MCQGWGSSGENSMSAGLRDIFQTKFPYLALAAGQGDVDESAGVDQSLLSTALGLLGLFHMLVHEILQSCLICRVGQYLLLLVDLGGGGLDLTGTSQTSLLYLSVLFSG